MESNNGMDAELQSANTIKAQAESISNTGQQYNIKRFKIYRKIVFILFFAFVIFIIHFVIVMLIISVTDQGLKPNSEYPLIVSATELLVVNQARNTAFWQTMPSGMLPEYQGKYIQTTTEVDSLHTDNLGQFIRFHTGILIPDYIACYYKGTKNSILLPVLYAAHFFKPVSLTIQGTLTGYRGPDSNEAIIQECKILY